MAKFKIFLETGYYSNKNASLMILQSQPIWRSKGIPQLKKIIGYSQTEICPHMLPY